MITNSTVCLHDQQQFYQKHNELTGYQKRTADKGIEKIQDDIMALHEAYQFLMKKYKLVDIHLLSFYSKYI